MLCKKHIPYPKENRDRMNLFKLLGLISTFALLVPLVMLLATRLTFYKSFPFLFVYYLILFTFNLLVLQYIQIPVDFKRYHGILNNLLDAPLMMGFLMYFCRTPQLKKTLKFALIGFLLFEVCVLVLYGYSRQASVIISGPGLLLVSVFALLFFIHQVKIAVVYHKAAGKALIIASVLFAYIGFTYVYVVFYFLNKSYQQDAHIVFFLITIFSSISISIGIGLERKRVRQLTELKTTREELKQLYAGQQKQTTTPLEAIVFKFDKKQWN